MFVVSVGAGQEVIEEVAREAKERGIVSAMVTLIGAVEHCAVSVMPADDPASDIMTEYSVPLELTGTGEIVDGGVHIHVTAGAESGTIAGHLHWARVEHWFVRVYVTPL